MLPHGEHGQPAPLVRTGTRLPDRVRAAAALALILLRTRAAAGSARPKARAGCSGSRFAFARHFLRFFFVVLLHFANAAARWPVGGAATAVRRHVTGSAGSSCRCRESAPRFGFPAQWSLHRTVNWQTPGAMPALAGLDGQLTFVALKSPGLSPEICGL